MPILTKLEFNLDSKKFVNKSLTISLDDKSGIFSNHSLGNLKINLPEYANDEGNRDHQVKFNFKNSFKTNDVKEMVLTFTVRTEWLRVGRTIVPSNLNGRGETLLDPAFIRQSEQDTTNDDTPTETSAPTVSQSTEEEEDPLEINEKNQEEVLNQITTQEILEEPVLENTSPIESESEPEPLELEPLEIERRRLLRIDIEKVFTSILLLLFLMNFLI